VIVREYVTSDGRNLFRNWLATLDRTTRARIQARVLRFSTGNLGDFKAVGGGVCEARVMFGPGFRVYFGLEGSRMVLLLIGGDKSSQSADIRRARECWAEYKEGNDGATESGLG
jgi:putative addiction module killer protein